MIGTEFILQQDHNPKIQSMSIKTIIIFIDILLFYSVKNKKLWKWQYGPHRALISTSWSLPGITRWDRRIWRSQHPQKICGKFSRMCRRTNQLSSFKNCVQKYPEKLMLFWKQRVVTPKIDLVQISLLLIHFSLLMDEKIIIINKNKLFILPLLKVFLFYSIWSQLPKSFAQYCIYYPRFYLKGKGNVMYWFTTELNIKQWAQA